MTDKLPSRLRQALVKAGYTDPRNGEPSVRALSADLGMNNSRVSRYFFQGSNMHLEARRQVAEALGVDVAALDSMVSDRKVDTYTPPEAANALTARERRLVNDLIHVLAERHEEGGGERADSSAATSTDPDDDSGATIHRAGFGRDTEDEEGEELADAEKYGAAAHPEQHRPHDEALDEQGL